MAERKERPGVLLYFDAIRPALKRLDDQQCGALLRAVVDYAEYGVVPDLDPMTGMAFDLLAPKIDRDGIKYEESREQRQYAVYCRERQKAGEPCMKIAEWRLAKYKPPDSKNIGPISPDNGSNGPYPTTTTTPSASISPSIPLSASTTTFTARTGEETGEETGERCKGEGEGEPTPTTLQAEWRAAKEAGDNKKALSCVNALCRQGYNIDFNTGELSRR